MLNTQGRDAGGESRPVFEDSDLVRQVRETGTMSFIDVDGTIAGYQESPSRQEIEARKEIREILDTETGVTLSTMRTPELCMSEELYLASRACGFNRKRPRCYVDKRTGRRVYRALDTLPKYTHNLDPHCISNPGTGVWVRRCGAYHQDRSFVRRYRGDYARWRSDVASLLEVVDRDYAIRQTFSTLECSTNYPDGVTDVEVREYCYELRFNYREGGEEWKKFVWGRLHSLPPTHPLAAVARTIDMIDESVPSLGRTQIYLVPHRRFTKEGATNHIVGSVSLTAGIASADITMVTFGDRMPDLKAGLMSGYDARGFFILAGGSPLTEYLVGNKRGKRFAGQSLQSIVRRLKPAGLRGFYTFRMYGMPCARVVVICDEAFSGMTDAQSVYQFLNMLRQWR